MQMRTALAAVLLAGVAGCSTPPPSAPTLAAGAVPAGTAQATVAAGDPTTSHVVDCRNLGSLTTITVGDSASGVSMMLDNRNTLTARSVALTNLGGFTGSYWRDLQGTAEVGMDGLTYTVTGTATGFNADNSGARATEPFTVKVAC